MFPRQRSPCLLTVLQSKSRASGPKGRIFSLFLCGMESSPGPVSHENMMEMAKRDFQAHWPEASAQSLHVSGPTDCFSVYGDTELWPSIPPALEHPAVKAVTHSLLCGPVTGDQAAAGTPELTPHSIDAEDSCALLISLLNLVKISRKDNRRLFSGWCWIN